MPRRLVAALIASLMLSACSTTPVAPGFRPEISQQGPALGPVGKVFILYAQAEGYDPLRRQAEELARVVERQLQAQGYATARGSRQDTDPDSLGTLRQAFGASGASHLMTIRLAQATVSSTGPIQRYTAECTLQAPGRSTGIWRYRAKQEDGLPETTARLSEDLIRAMQAAGMTRASSSASTTPTQGNAAP